MKVKFFILQRCKVVEVKNVLQHQEDGLKPMAILDALVSVS